MPSFDSRTSESQSKPEYTAESIPKLVDTVRLDRYVPSSNAYEARHVHSSLLPSLSALAELIVTGTAARNFTARSSDLPLSLEVRDVTSDIEARIGSWKVEARADAQSLEAIMIQLRKLGVEAIGIYSSSSGDRSKSDYAWICAANYEDLKLITAAPKQAAVPELVILDLSLPAANTSTVALPANASRETVGAGGN